MPISVTCSSCGKRLKARDELAGKTLPCPNCRAKVLVAQPDEDSAGYLLKPETPSRAAPKPAPSSERPRRPIATEPREPKRRPAAPSSDTPSLPPLKANEPPLWLRHLHWLLALALLPLAFSLLKAGHDADTYLERCKVYLENAPPEKEERFLEQLLKDPEGVFALLPEHKFDGAFLSRGSQAHWGFAAGAIVLFMAFLLLLSAHQTAQPFHLLAIGFFTATIGLMLLFLLQWVADATRGVWVHGGSIVTILFYIVKFIGYSYQSALDPENGFVLSFFGFTLGVGLCEEACKALPLLWLYRQKCDQKWRGALLWGLASGAGFGIAEGIIYAANHYNGISGPGIYLVRFLSCVALHAVWTGSVGLFLNQNQGLIQAAQSWHDYLFRVILILGIPMILHGLYDTLLKKDLNGGALVVAVLSFVYLAFQISRVHSGDDEESRKELLREYQRRRAAMS